MTTTTSELTNNFSKFYNRVVKDGQPLVISEQDKPQAVLINYSIYIDLLEDLELKERFSEAYKSTRKEPTINLNELKIKYGLS